MALGPLLSFPLQQLPDTRWHGIHINPITAAGYVMSALWLVFAVVCQCFFTDPLQVLRCAFQPVPLLARLLLASATVAVDGAVTFMKPAEEALPGRERNAARADGAAEPLLQESRRDSISRMESALPQAAPTKAEAHSKLDGQQLQARRELWASLPPTFVAIAFLWVLKAVQQVRRMSLNEQCPCALSKTTGT